MCVLNSIFYYTIIIILKKLVWLFIMNFEHIFRKIKISFNLFAILRQSREAQRSRIFVIVQGHSGSYKKLHRGKRKTSLSKKTIARQKRKGRRTSIKIAWEMQLINWRIIVRYWPRPIIPSFSPRLGSVCALPGCLTSCSLERKPSNRAINRI